MKNTCTLLAECWGVDSQVNSGMTQQWLPSVPDWRLPWLVTYGTKSLFYVCHNILIIESFLSPTLWRWTAEHLVSPVVCQDDQAASIFITNSLSSPLFLVTGGSKWHMYTGTSGRRGETVWLIGDISPEGMPPAFLTKKKKKRLTVSVRSFGRHGHQEAGDWRGPEWQKTRQNWDNK